MADATVEQTDQSRAKVFISYSRKDMAFADRLDAALKARGFEPLIDRTDIYAFEEWWKRVEELIARADTVIFVLSPDAVRPGSVAMKEIAFAASLNKRFAPIVFHPVEDKDLPEALAKLNFIFFDDPACFEASADQLVQALSTDIGWIRQHTDFGEQARRWALANRPTGLLLRSPVLEQAERWIALRPSSAPAPTEETQTFIRRSRQAATRRRNVLTGSLAAGLVLALGLAGLAYWQRGVAVEQRQIAQQNEAQANTERDNATRNFKLAQKTAESLVFDIAQGLRNVQGMGTETVRKILETAKATFEQLMTSAPDDLALQRSRASMLDEFAQTYQSLGDLDAALKASRDGLAIAERLVAADPGNTQWQHDLSVSYDSIGLILEDQGQLDEALKSFRTGLAIRDHLAAIDPANPNWQRALSTSYVFIGDVLMSKGDLPGGLKEYERSRDIDSRLAAADPSNPQLQRTLWISLNKIGDALMPQGKLDEALRSYREGLAIAERVAAMDRDNARWQYNLSISREKIGDVMVGQGKPDEAVKAYRDGIAVRERLAKADPSNTDWQRNLSVLYNRTGDVLADHDKLDEAVKAYGDGLAIRERLAKADPTNTGWQHDLAVSYDRLGEVTAREGNLTEALKAYRAGLAILERLAKTDPANVVWQRNLSMGYGTVADVLRAQGNLTEAFKAYSDGLAVNARLVSIDRSNRQWQQDLQLFISRVDGIAFQFVLTRNFENALEAASQAISLAPQEISIYALRAHALMFLDRVDEARALYLKYRGAKNVIGDKSWEDNILEDFAELRNARLSHPLMDEIERKFTTSG
jgi:tetratricopeptide (TPR) repeat protein